VPENVERASYSTSHSAQSTGAGLLAFSILCSKATAAVPDAIEHSSGMKSPSAVAINLQTCLNVRRRARVRTLSVWTRPVRSARSQGCRSGERAGTLRPFKRRITSSHARAMTCLLRLSIT
jgi:hypothetical protein